MEATLRDQRVMVGFRVHESAEQVREAWQVWADAHGLPIRRRLGDYSTELHESRKIIAAFVSAGNWTATCPGCNGGCPTWPPRANDKGHTRACCLDCGTIYRVRYPAAAEIAAGEQALSVRPVDNRNWQPDSGETSADLRAENITRGYHIDTDTAEAGEAEMLSRFLEREGDAGVALLRKLGALPEGPDELLRRLTAERGGAD